MTPHERAEETICRWYKDGSHTSLVQMVVHAVEEATADLRDLLAQQAARADAAEAQIKQRDATCARCDSKGPKAENTIWCASCLEWWREEYRSQYEADEKLDAALAQVTRYNEMAGRDADELARLRARIEQLEEALEDAEATLDAIESGRGGCNQHWCAETAMGQRARRAALSATPGEWLEEQLREAKAEELEALASDCSLSVFLDGEYGSGVQNERESWVERLKERAATLRQGGK
jgi:hypothetical protein